MTRPLNIGLLGAARISPKALCQPAAVIPAARLYGISARNKQRASLFAEEHGVREVFDTYESLIESDEIDLIYNPLPINRHAEWTIRALEAGKHVLCEKPLAMNMDEATAMQAAAQKSGKRLIEAFHYRYHPAFRQCLDWVRDGLIGTVQTVDAVFNVEIRDSDDEIRQLPETGGGAMMDLGCYPLSWALHLMDQAPTSVTAEATLTKRGVDESLQARLEFGDAATAKLTTSMAQGTPFKAEMTVKGSGGSISFVNPLAPHQGGHLTMMTKGGEVNAPVSPISSYTWQLAAVTEALRTDTALPTEGEAMLTQQAQLDAIYEAAGLRGLRYR
ncbi:Gfo/Idh/MocA family oxidoreductase [Henriciella sp.]|uniref:Gfo/Idh/MocA family protein n=1 Tax=Henriciella sp. TaxID=1968823 RepID=UPI002610487A|nr:Gfo/Idh/MocA family oxidoreductase [Henriciella sp.]